MDELIKRIKKFRDERDWEQFHSPENLAKSIVIEAAELLEIFQWDNKFDEDKVKDELADVMNYCLLMADTLNLDIVECIDQKIEENEIQHREDMGKS